MCFPDVPYRGWSVVARLHYGQDLSEYVGFSVAVFDLDLEALAKATSILVFVGVGSYVAYRVLLGTLNTVDLLRAFLFYVEAEWYSDVYEKSDVLSENEVNGDGVYSLSREAQPIVAEVASCSRAGTDAVERRKGKNETTLSYDHIVARLEPSGSPNVAQSLPFSCHSSPLHRRHIRSTSPNSSSSILNDSSASCLSSTPFQWDYEWAAFVDHSQSLAKRRSTSTGLSPRKRALLSSNGLCSYSDFSSEHSQLYSRDPSEWSEIVESRLVGEGTIAQLDLLQGDIVDLRSEMEMFQADCDRYVEDRQATMGDLKNMYRSVPPTSHSGSSLPDAECPSPSSSSTNMFMMASCDSVCTCRPAAAVLCPSCGTQIPTSRCRGCAGDVALPAAIQDSYHSFISADLVPSVSSSSGDVAAMGASFVDSCISSFDDNCFGYPSCSSSAAVGRSPKVKSFDVEHASRVSPPSRVSTASSSPWFLADINDFLCKNVADSLKLSHVTCQLIHRRALKRVFVPFGGQLNIVQAILYHMCLGTRLPLADTLSNSIRVSAVRELVRSVRPTSGRYNCLMRTKFDNDGELVWKNNLSYAKNVELQPCSQFNKNGFNSDVLILRQKGSEEMESGIRECEANLSLYETAVKVLVAWNVLIQHSSIVSEEETDSSQTALCDQSETISIFVNILQKPAEDFSYTEIASLAKILDVTIEVFELYAEPPRLLNRYPNVQSAACNYEGDCGRYLPLLSVVPCNYLPVV